MTLRAWTFLLLIGLFAFILSAHADAESVWDQASAPLAIAKVTGLESQGDSVIYTLNVNGETRSVPLCAEGKQQLVGEGPMGDLLRQAFFHGNAVKVSITGPWQPCLRTVHVI